MLIDLFQTKLVAGYQTVKNYRQRQLAKWRFPLLRAYAQKWEAYAQKLARQTVQQQQIGRYLRWLVLLLPLIFSSGCLLSFSRYWDLGLALAGWSLTATLIALIVWAAFSIRPKPPENPLTQSAKTRGTSPLKHALFPDLVPSWRQGLAVAIPSEAEVALRVQETKKWGLIGEFDLVRRLAEVVSPETFILHSVMPKPHDDLDVILIGPKGIWYFEVKYEKAEFIWQNGVWQIWKFDHQTRQTVKVTWSEYPDAQWYRMRAEATQNLKTNAPEIFAKAPHLLKIAGGIVFAHPKVKLSIQPHPPFPYGNPGGWLSKYRAAPNLPAMTPETSLRLTEILLAKHQSLNPAQRVNSMEAYAEAVIRRNEKNLQNWINQP